VGRYRLEAVVGRGGMGTVYRASDPDTKREVAIKILAPDLPDTLRQRFLAECEAEAQIRHPHVMPVYDRGRFGEDRLYFVMELVYEPITLTDVVTHVQKGTLAQAWPRLRHWSNPQRLVADVIVPICEGVDAANREYGYLHRDLKPDNVLIDVRTRRPYLIDFGICHQLGTDPEAGKIVGTPRFLSPEQVLGKADPRTDVWGLGALLFYVLSGSPPIEGSSPMRREERAKRVEDLVKAEAKASKAGQLERVAELAARREGLADPNLRLVEDMLKEARDGHYLALPDHVSAPLQAIIAKAMQRNPVDRYESVAALADDLRAWTSGGKVRAHAEADAAGAAVDQAKRAVRRHLVTALWVLAGAVVGLALTLHFRRSGAEASPPNAGSELRALSGAVDLLGEEAPGSVEAAVRWRELVHRMDELSKRVATWPAGADRKRAEDAVEALRERVPKAELILIAPQGGTTQFEARSAVRALAGTAYPLRPGPNRLPPGPYLVHPRGATAGVPVLLPFVVTFDDAPATGDGVRVYMDLPPGGVPEGMVYVAAGSADPGGAREPAFLIGTREVTNLEYAAWLDELADGDRAARVPSRGFMRDPTTPGRLIVAPDLEDEPVVGIRPADAAAYAAWRAEVWNVPIRLPTVSEWRRAAGAGMLDASHGIFFSSMRAGGEGQVVPDRTPYGATGMLTHPAEYAATEDGFVVLGVGRGLGIAPTASAFARTEPARGDEVHEEAGFRIAQGIR
jgi:hypothetical protein